MSLNSLIHSRQANSQKRHIRYNSIELPKSAKIWGSRLKESFIKSTLYLKYLLIGIGKLAVYLAHNFFESPLINVVFFYDFSASRMIIEQTLFTMTSRIVLLLGQSKDVINDADPLRLASNFVSPLARSLSCSRNF